MDTHHLESKLIMSVSSGKNNIYLFSEKVRRELVCSICEVDIKDSYIMYSQGPNIHLCKDCAILQSKQEARIQPYGNNPFWHDVIYFLLVVKSNFITEARAGDSTESKGGMIIFGDEDAYLIRSGSDNIGVFDGAVKARNGIEAFEKARELFNINISSKKEKMNCNVCDAKTDIIRMIDLGNKTCRLCRHCHTCIAILSHANIHEQHRPVAEFLYNNLTHSVGSREQPDTGKIMSVDEVVSAILGDVRDNQCSGKICENCKIGTIAMGSISMPSGDTIPAYVCQYCGLSRPIDSKEPESDKDTCETCENCGNESDLFPISNNKKTITVCFDCIWIYSISNPAREMDKK